MVSFKTNKILLDQETASLEIKKRRQEKNLSIDEISKKLNISARHLEAIEQGSLNSVPSGIYGKNFLKEYIVFLGLDYKEFIEIFEKDFITRNKKDEKEMFSRQVAKNSYFLATPKIIKNTIIFVITLGCFFYLGYAIKNIISPPSLAIESPENNYVTTKKTVEVRGTTEKEAEIKINGETILGDADGNFSKEISLKDGVNNIIITAKKKHGKEIVIQRQILVKKE